MRVALPLLLIALCGAAPCAGQASALSTSPSVALPADLDRVLRDYERAWQAGDEQALVALFTEDGFVRRPPGWTRGRDAILEAYRDAGGDLRLRALAYATADTVGYIVGAYGYGEEAADRDVGSFLLALRRSAPTQPWRIAADLDHSNQPPQ